MKNEDSPDGRNTEEETSYSDASGFRTGWSVTDEPETADRLGFDSHSIAVTNYILDEFSQPPMTISIEGGSGSGKFTFLRHIERRTAEKGALTVWYTPWRYERESIADSFIINLLQQLAFQLNLTTRLFAQIRLAPYRFNIGKARRDLSRVLVIGLIVSFLAVRFPDATRALGPLLIERYTGISLNQSVLDGVGTVLMVFALVGLGVWINNNVYDPVSSRINEYVANPLQFEQLSLVDRLYEDLDRILDVYVGDHPVVVFIDSLEDCEPARTAGVLGLIRRLTENSIRIIFVVGVNREQLLETLTPELLSGADPAEYLETVITVSHGVPAPDEMPMEKLFKNIDSYQPLDLVEISRMVVPLLDSPRQLKKFHEMFRLRKHVAIETGLISEWDDLKLEAGKLVAIDMRWSQLSAIIDENPMVFDELQQAAVSGSPLVEICDIVEEFSDAEREQLRELLKFQSE